MLINLLANLTSLHFEALVTSSYCMQEEELKAD